MIRALSQELQDEYDKIVDDFCNQDSEDTPEKFFKEHASKELYEQCNALYEKAEELRSQGIMV